MRWIHHGPDGRRDGTDAPPGDLQGVIHMISSNPAESMALDTVRGLLYRGGLQAEPGTYRVPFASGTLPIVVDAKGKASRRPVEPPAPPVTPPTPPAGGGPSAQGR